MKTLRLYKVLRPFRLKERVLWQGDRLILAESVAAEHVARGELAITENRNVVASSWDEGRMTR